MKRKLSLLILFAFLFQLFSVFSPNVALAYFSTRNYGWTLGYYDPGSQKIIPSNTDSTLWNNMWVWTCGPMDLIVSDFTGTYHPGSILLFDDKSRPKDNGYPVIGDDQLDYWINYFGGNNWYVRTYALHKQAKTKAIGYVDFWNFSDVVQKCGGQGSGYNNKTVSYLKTPVPISTFTVDKTSVTQGDPVYFNISAKTFSKYGAILFVTMENVTTGEKYMNNQRFDSATMSSSRKLTMNFPRGTYQFKLTIRDFNYRYATDKYVSVGVGEIPPLPPADDGGGDTPSPDEPPPPPPPPPVNQPPTARFSWPSSVYEGDTVTVTEDSFDWDGQIIDRQWQFSSTTGVTHNLSQGGGPVTFDNTGSYNLSLTVTDDDGATDSVSHSITVLPVIPTAKIAYSGTLKENRKVVLDAVNSTSFDKFPIDHTKDEWTIAAISGGAGSDIRIGIKTGTTQEVLFKKAGTYRIGLRVYNSRHPSEWTYKDIIIAPDLPPVANFTKASIAFRNPADQVYATVFLVDKSFSADGDSISQRIWRYKFDSNNDGSFLDESWVTLDSSNNPKPFFRTNHVGQYLFDLEVKEAFGQETIPAFITDADYLRGDTSTKPQMEKVLDVKNIAPVTSFAASVKPKVDIAFSQGFLTDYNNRFPALVNNLETIVGSKLKAKNIDYAFYNTDVRGGVEWIERTSEGPWGPDHINDVGTGYCVKTRILDLGKSVPISDIVNCWINYNGYCYANHTTTFNIAVSNDNVTWYTIHTWISPSQPNNWRPSNTLSNFQSGIPISSIRYVKGFIDSTDYALDVLTVDILFNSQNNTINQADSNIQKSKVFDIGRSISTSSLSEHRILFQGTAAGTYTLAVSPDNVNWYNVGSWNCTIASGRTIVYEFRYISNTVIPVPNFRFVKLSVNGSANITYFQQFVTYKSATQATLNDIKNVADHQYRSGAKKYVISLAEEPYTDASSAAFIQTADALNGNNAYFVVFTNAAGMPTVQQLTTQLTNQTIIDTTTDMSLPLEQLADYIIGTASPASMSGTVYALLGESLNYNPNYSDYETDPKVAENWSYVHDPDFLDNSSGISFYNDKVVSGPVSVLDKPGKYDVKYLAMDDPAAGDLRFLNYRLWSDPAPATVIVHRKPVADFSVQPGTLNITDLSYDPDFQFRRPDKGVVEWYWKWRPVSSTLWTIGNPSGISAPGDYVLHLEVKDVYGAWSDPVEKTITVNSLAKPPVVDFTWTPALIYEGDTVNLINLSSDPGGLPLTYRWTVYSPAGDTSLYTTTNVTLNNVLPGTYWVTLRAANTSGFSAVVTKSFIVNILGITGYVRHTPEWDANRINYNRYHTGTDDSPRGYDVFWAGEAFELQAGTTDTGTSATRAQSVGVILLEKGYTTTLTGNAGRTFWTGELFRDDLANLADGTYTFRFTVSYSNGVIKTDDVPVVISGTWLDYFKFHRAW